MDRAPHPPRVLQFLNYLQFERHFSNYTSRCYGADLRQFCQFLLGIPAEIMPDDIDIGGSLPMGFRKQLWRWWNPLPQGGYVSRSTATTLLLNSTAPEDVRNYLGFMRENNLFQGDDGAQAGDAAELLQVRPISGMTANNPMLDHPHAQAGKSLSAEVHESEEQVTKLLQTPRDGDILGARDKAMLEALYSTGIRVSELIGLNAEDVDFTGNVIRVRGKGKKERIAPMGPTAITAIQKYIVMRNAIMKDDVTVTALLFVNKHGQRLSTRSVRRKLDRIT